MHLMTTNFVCTAQAMHKVWNTHQF